MMAVSPFEVSFLEVVSTRLVRNLCTCPGVVEFLLLSGGFLFLRRIHPGCARQLRRDGRLADEAFGVREVDGVQDLGAPVRTAGAWPW